MRQLRNLETFQGIIYIILAFNIACQATKFRQPNKLVMNRWHYFSLKKLYHE